MPLYTIGEVIRRERTAQGITQEELAHNICSTSWLSKIESGTKTPTTQTFELLMRRLGKTTSQYVLYKGDKEMQVEALKTNFKKYLRAQKMDLAEQTFKAFVAARDPESVIDQQFELYYGTLLHQKHITDEERLECFQRALSLTQDSLLMDELDKYLLSSNEIGILNSIAVTLYSCHKEEESVKLLRKLIHYLEKPNFDIEVLKEIYPIVLYNLSKYLGMMGDFSECMLCCDKAIEFSIENNVHNVLVEAIFNKAWLYAEYGDKNKAREYFTQAFYMDRALKNEARAAQTKEAALTHWKIDIG